MGNLEILHDWCALWRIPKVGAKRFSNILQASGSPKAFFKLSDSSKRQFGIKVDSDIFNKARRGADKDIRWLQDNPNAQILTREDTRYPKQLLNIPDPPPVLFVLGNGDLLSVPQLAIVGSRSPSYEGIENAKNFSSYLTQNGIVITSGLALGVDGIAHEGCFLANENPLSGQTIAVMGTGADTIYPAKHQKLAYRILERGCIITELPIGTPVVPRAFPIRNRIISGLSLGALVIEAGLKSGSLITAQSALEQNREVFAIPGSIHNPLARGCNYLIRNGAKLVETAEDIFNELKPSLIPFVENKKSATLSNGTSSQTYSAVEKKETDLFEVDSEQQKLWNALSYDPQPVDILSDRSGIPTYQVSSMLLILELQEKVIKQPGGKYQKKGE